MESIQNNSINSAVKIRKRTRKLASLNEDISDEKPQTPEELFLFGPRKKK